jgi:hypothetical protein
MISRVDRFWITFILRLGFGLFFAIAAINIFCAGGPTDTGFEWFADNVSKAFTSTWLGDIDTSIMGMVAAILPEHAQPSKSLCNYFLRALPFLFAAISLPILLGVFLRPALRLGALLLVLLGLGKYISSGQDLSTTAHDFFFAFLICSGLYFLGQEKAEEAPAERPWR